ncbi:hypothetical protein [Dysgonomonas sp. BGC7]|uniref:hypothetical protein n=1 Tax=Dysgonomonas sp. BGC7 TaxID=1658008 RepID=UPI0006836F2C|nr:hypothetical protein [Dysgonomonas sp. BGC7]MBD8389910.1 hypothetical protein [Dysgonomonas sp. BGC7]
MLNHIDENKNPFKVPENYFQNFNAEIMDKLPAKEANKGKIVPLWKKVIPWTAVAAVFAGVLFLTGVFNRTTVNPDTTAHQPESAITNGLASTEDEEYYYSFIEDEVVKAKYKEMIYNQ